MANLLVDLGDWAEAEKNYENVISLKNTVCGTKRLPVAWSTLIMHLLRQNMVK